ncbi:hypothetical protein HK100_003971 [Physocladia obscura]|uniref:glutaminase n=1 Tax=Physocladia obscura TaxID=109957 RepID=A0AAD5STF8_9FUNG|nr:hypothetical protein HK100_003971 [Physocladia obscura]
MIFVNQLKQTGRILKTQRATRLIGSFIRSSSIISNDRITSLVQNLEQADLRDLQRRLIFSGFLPDDPRFRPIFHPSDPNTEEQSAKRDNMPSFDVNNAEEVCSRALRGSLAIPAFQTFRTGVSQIFEKIKHNGTDLGGNVATYIALEEVGANVVHEHVGREPSGLKFNHMSLLHDKIPHNPMINAGAIMSSSLIQQGKPFYQRFGEVTQIWTRLFGGKKIHFNNSVYLSEKGTADRNYALGHMMMAAGGFPEHTNLQETLELEADTDRMAVMAATYANGGVCPLTNETVFSPSTIRNSLSLMASCGMYDYSGEWNFRVGLPAKSGVSGAMWVVVPNVGGFCCYSPAIDGYGNGVKGLEFFKELSVKYAFHLLEPERLSGLKIDPTADGVKNGVAHNILTLENE